MKTELIIERLNDAVRLEYGAFHMYLQFSMLVHGEDRIKWQDFFETQSQEALVHAKRFAAKIVALGGVPTVESAPFQQSQDLSEMLELARGTERSAVLLYSAIHALVEGQDKPLQYLLEQQIQDEQQDVEEIERFLRRGEVGGLATARSARNKSAATASSKGLPSSTHKSRASGAAP